MYTYWINGSLPLNIVPPVVQIRHISHQNGDSNAHTVIPHLTGTYMQQIIC